MQKENLADYFYTIRLDNDNDNTTVISPFHPEEDIYIIIILYLYICLYSYIFTYKYVIIFIYI